MDDDITDGLDAIRDLIGEPCAVCGRTSVAVVHVGGVLSTDWAPLCDQHYSEINERGYTASGGGGVGHNSYAASSAAGRGGGMNTVTTDGLEGRGYSVGF